MFRSTLTDGLRKFHVRREDVRETRTVSISTTVLKPFSDSLEIGARKFPAAPTCQSGMFQWECTLIGGILTTDDEVNPAKFLDSLCDGVLQLFGVSYIGLYSYTFTRSGRSKLICSSLKTIQPCGNSSMSPVGWLPPQQKDLLATDDSGFRTMSQLHTKSR